MTDKALISELTWRSLDMQCAAFPDMPHFVGPSELPTLLRQTQRNKPLSLHVLSLGIIAETKDAFVAFMKSLPKNVTVVLREEGCKLMRSTPIRKAIELWTSARKFGAAKVGGRISADKRKAESAVGIAKIKDRWPRPSEEWPTSVLLKEAGISLNTAKAALGRRPIEQANYQAKLKRQKARAA